MKVIHFVGRIMLLAAAVLIFVNCVPVIIQSVEYFQGINWSFADILTDSVKQFNLGNLVGQGLNALLGLIAVIAALIGRKSFILALCAIGVAIAPIYTLVTGIQAGIVFDGPRIWSFVCQFSIPVLYFFGFLLV